MEGGKERNNGVFFRSEDKYSFYIEMVYWVLRIN